MVSEPTPLSVAQIVRLVQAREMLPSEIIAPFIARSRSLEPHLHAYVTPMLEAAQEQADALDRKIKAGESVGSLAGVPYSLKDVIETAGVRTTAQSRSRADHIPARSADVHVTLEAAGAVLAGKAATWEFAHGGPSWDVLQEPARNPWNTDYDPSGSSSGSAVGVAAGYWPASLGTDTGGSVRGPAGACGIVGLKPTAGLISTRGVISNSFSLDTVGPMAWTAEDVALLFEALTRPARGGNAHDALDVGYLHRSLGGLVIGVPHAWIEREWPVSEEVRTAFDAALNVLSGLGARITRVDLPALQLFEDAKKIIAAAELYTSHGPVLRQAPQLLGRSFRVRMAAGAFVSASAYLNAQRWRLKLSEAVQRIMGEVDVIALPTGEPARPLTEGAPEALLTNFGFHAAFSMSGNPALASRMGFSKQGLPLSLQLVGRLHDDRRVLSVAHQYEAATTWSQVRPDPLAVGLDASPFEEA